jgi:hypothetical protein
MTTSRSDKRVDVTITVECERCGAVLRRRVRHHRKLRGAMIQITNHLTGHGDCKAHP